MANTVLAGRSSQQSAAKKSNLSQEATAQIVIQTRSFQATAVFQRQRT
jgi:hypothetical protein